MYPRPAVRRMAAGFCTVLAGTAVALPASPSGAAVPAGTDLVSTALPLVERTAAAKAGVVGTAAQPGTGAAADVAFTVECTPDSVAVGEEATCTIRAVNSGFDDQVVDIDSKVNRKLVGTSVDGAIAPDRRHSFLHDAALPGRANGVPSVEPGTTFGYLPLDAFGITPVPIGDEEFLAFNTPPFVYGGQTFTVISVNSNGYLIPGVVTSDDNNCCDLPDGPSPARPNNVLAPFWTDLDGTGAPGVFAGVLTDGVNDWLVVEHRVNVFGTESLRVFQVWIGLNGVQDISFAYDPDNLPAPPPAGEDFLVGAENSDGLGDMVAVAPTTDLLVTSGEPGPPGEVAYTTTVRGKRVGLGVVSSRLTIEGELDTTKARDTVEVTAP